MRSILLAVSSAVLGIAGLMTPVESGSLPVEPTRSVERGVRDLEDSEARAATGEVQKKRWFKKCRAIVGVCFRESGARCVCVRGVPILTACFLCTLDPAVRRCSAAGLRCPLVAGAIHPCGMQEVGQCQPVSCACLGTGAFLGACANVQDEC